MSLLQQAKLALAGVTHLGKDALHVYVALGVFFAGALLFKWPLKSPKLWLLVFAVTFAGELWDIADSFVDGRAHNFNGSWKDVVNTMFWPTVISALARWTKIFTRR
jgi:hypothetical protein